MRRVVVVIALAVLTAVSCRDQSLTVIAPSELPDDVYGPPSPTPTAELPKEETVYMVRNGRLVPVKGPLQPVASSLPEALLLTLLQGPAEPGLRTAIPPDTRINEVSVTGQVANVDLSQEFERGGSGREFALRVAQVVYSLTEAPEVTSVAFSIGGFPRAVVNADGARIAGPVGREDYEDFVPRDGSTPA